MVPRFDVLTLCVLFTTAFSVKQEFEPLMTADFANSSIWQRVLDSHGLLFWIQPKLTGQLYAHSLLEEEVDRDSKKTLHACGLCALKNGSGSFLVLWKLEIVADIQTLYSDMHLYWNKTALLLVVWRYDRGLEVISSLGTQSLLFRRR